MNPLLKDFLTYSRTQRTGIFVLLFLIVAAQALYLLVEFPEAPSDSAPQQQWLALQDEIDSLKAQKRQYKPTIYPYNPNFITDFKGYKLGMSVDEIDRLVAFRKQNKYVNSASEFQQVTKVSDSLLQAMSPYFKFPEWVTNKRKSFQSYDYKKKKEKPVVLDINKATKDDLVKVYGIGPALSERILKQKEALGGFVSMKQLEDVWGLSPEVIENLDKSFEVQTLPSIKKLHINEASVKELGQFPYFRYPLSKQIVTYRSMNGGIKSSADLLKINGFPVDRAEIIALYLEF